MTEISQRILDFVRRELVEDPSVENAVLYKKAQQLDPAAMKDVDRRQFNARYPLRVKRFEMKARKPRPAGEKKKPKARRTRKTPAVPTAGRATGNGDAVPGSRSMSHDGVREILLRFAQDLASADSRGEIVSVVAGIDQYVEQVVRLGSTAKA